MWKSGCRVPDLQSDIAESLRAERMQMGPPSAIEAAGLRCGIGVGFAGWFCQIDSRWTDVGWRSLLQ
jgi:hypothetical protein